MSRVYSGLMARWLPVSSTGISLKTDLFEEAISSHEVLSRLGADSIGLDVSPAVVSRARQRLRSLGGRHRFVVGDLRRVPLRSGSVNRVLSGSSLDHFRNKEDTETGLAEVTRVLAPGGLLLVTFDNPRNPAVWLRNRLPFAWLHRLGLVPYYVGRTFGHREARRRLEALGLTVTDVTAVAHVPRAPAIWIVRWLGARWGTRLGLKFQRMLWAWEALERWPTRYWTGYYVALRAEKPGPDTIAW
jgi:SAM-dependent methyltransferase